MLPGTMWGIGVELLAHVCTWDVVIEIKQGLWFNQKLKNMKLNLPAEVGDRKEEVCKGIADG